MRQVKTPTLSNFKKKFAIFASAAFLFLLTFFSFASTTYSAGNQSPVFLTPVNVSDSAQSAIYPMVASSGSHVYVVWTELGYGIYFRASADNGTTWNPPLSSPAMKIGRGGSFPIIAANGSDIYVVWSGVATRNLTQIYLAASTNYGESFNAAVDVEPPYLQNTSAETPYVAAGDAGYAFVSYVVDPPASGAGDYAVATNNAGASWLETYQFSPDHEAQIAAYGKSAYAIGDGARGAAYTHNGGASWSKTTKGIGGCCGSEPWIAVDGNNVLVVWETKTNASNVYAVASTNGGLSYTKTLLSSSTPDSWAPMIAVSGNVEYVAWRTNPGTINSREYVSVSLDAGMKWSAPLMIGLAGKDNEWPFTVSASGSNAFVMWAYQFSTPNDWHAVTAYSSDNGTTWSVPVDLSTAQNAGISPEGDIATGAMSITSTLAYAVWQNASPGASNVQVYFTLENYPSGSGTSTQTSTSSASSSTTISTSTSVQSTSSTTTTSDTSTSSVSSTSSTSIATRTSLTTTSVGLSTSTKSTSSTTSSPPAPLFYVTIAAVVGAVAAVTPAGLYLRKKTRVHHK